MKEKFRIHLFIAGTVQGVFFRAHTRNVAQASDLTGWVRNLPDGRVEVIAEGGRDRIAEFIRWCHKGPAMASVANVEIYWEEATGEFKDFGIQYLH
ncbi:acylphosphatase [candidate division WOR_3 bacterium SM23_42]|uniref:Acylphosphatase n=1 Tax=candidate division WOR_3 bacterium SM23_42 TaxID=1703779 RepID=A0A0S8FUN7_UNCW3|nr:MAG: acylphosphatase [candidate division WOR_3 bacterium SM23_42]